MKSLVVWVSLVAGNDTPCFPCKPVNEIECDCSNMGFGSKFESKEIGLNFQDMHSQGQVRPY